VKLRLPIVAAFVPLLSAQVALPIAEDFELEPTCDPVCETPCLLAGDWVNATDDGAEWIVQSGATPSTATGPSVDFDPGLPTGQYAYVEASGSCAPTVEAWLMSPVIDPAGGALLSFRYHQDGVDMGSLSVDQQEPERHTDGLLTGATETLTSTAADFSVLLPGMHITILGSLANDGVFEVVSVLDANTVVLDTGGGAIDEGPLTFDAWHPDAPWTLDVFGPVTHDEDAWQHASCVALVSTGAETRVRFAALTGSGFASDMALDAISIESPAAVDLAIESLSVDPLGCGETATALTVALVNRGQSVLTDVSLSFQIDGGPSVTEVVPGPIAPCAAVEHTFAAPVELATLGSHEITAFHSVPADAVPEDDTATLPVYAPPILNTYPSSDDLETDAADRWRTGGSESSWAVGEPAKAVITGAASGAVAWVTGGLGGGGYNPDEDSWVEGPCYDLTTLSEPRVELSAWWDSEFGWDGAMLEGSVDDGGSWVRIGAFGDDLNWYTDSSVDSLPGGQGWSGATSTSNGSGGWIQAGHALDGFAGEPLVRLRVRFGSDGTVQDDGFAFDDWVVLDDPPGVTVTRADSTIPVAALPAHTASIEVLAFDVEARGSDSEVSELSLSLSGVVDADVAAVELWLDDGDGVFDPLQDFEFATNPQVPVDGLATFGTVNELVLPAWLPRRVFGSVELQPSAAGSVIQASLAPSDIVTTGTLLLVDPIHGPPRGVFAPTVPPLFDDLSGGSSARTIDVGPGSFPEASIGAPVLGPTTSLPGTIELVDLTLAAVNPSEQLRIAAPDAAAVDYHVDLSGQLPGSADLTLGFTWQHQGGQVDAGDGVFASVDGGLSWSHTLFSLPSGPSVRLEETLDLDAALLGAGLPFNDQLVLRFQAVGAAAEDLLLDDVFVATLAKLRVDRGGTLDDGVSHDLGDLPAATPTVVAFELHNDGDFDLTLGPPVVSDPVNVGAVVVSSPTSLAPGAVDTLTLELTAVGDGPVSLDLAFAADDPRLADGVFDLSLVATGTVEPDLAVAYLGVPRFDGDILDAGVQSAGSAIDVELELSNVGTGPLSFTGAAPLLFINAQNVGAVVLSSPPNPMPAGDSAVAKLSVTPTADGVFSVDVLVQTDDPDTPLMVLTLDGLGVSPGLQIVRGSIIPPGGTEDAGPRRPGDVITWGYSLHNTGTGDVTLTGSPDPVTIANAAGPVLAAVTAQPAILIPIGASVGFVLDVEVTGLGLFSFDLVVESNDAQHPLYVISVVGEGVEPELQVSDGSGILATGDVVDVGDVRVGETVAWLAAVQNTGTGDLTLLDDPPAALSDLVASSAEVTLQPAAIVAPGGSEPLEVELTATALGPFSAVVTLSSDDADEPSTSLLLQGTGVLPSLRVERAGSPLSDGDTDVLGEFRRLLPSSLTWVVSNDGTGPLELIGSPEPLAVLDVVGVQVAVIVPPPPTLQPGDEAMITLEVVPLDDVFSFDLVLPSDDPDTPVFTLHAEGVAVAPSLSVSRAGVPIPADGVDDLGEVALSPTTLGWTLTNLGSAGLSWTSPPTLEASGDVLVELAEVPDNVPPGAERELRLAVVPGVDGPFAFDVVLHSDDPDVPDYPFTVVATVVSPFLRLSRNGVELGDGAVDSLGELEVGRSVTWTWALRNEGTADAQMLQPDPILLRDLEGFAVEGLVQPPSVLVSGTSAEVAVTAQPNAEGEVGFELVVRQAGGKEITLRASGRAVEVVEPPAPPSEGCTCSASGSSWTGTLLLPLLWLRRRRTA
jgi:hypothetical protein